MHSLTIISAFVALASFCNPVAADHDPTTVNPPLEVISTKPDAWRVLEDSPIGSSFQCYAAPPGFVPDAVRVSSASLRVAAATLNTTHTGNCFPRKPPGCHLLAIDGYTRISFCAMSEGGPGNGNGGKPEDPKEVKNLCTTLREVITVFQSPGKCFYRGLTGGFVRFDEGRFAGDVLVLWSDFTDRPAVTPRPLSDVTN